LVIVLHMIIFLVHDCCVRLRDYEKLDNGFVINVDNIFSLWEVAFVIDHNPQKLYLSTCFSSFGSFYKFVDWIVCCLVDSLCSLGYIRCYCYVITEFCRFPVVGYNRIL
jgi:hypothetical protein